MAYPIRSVLVIGAGMAGLVAAKTIAEAGLSITILDKGRKPGGRIATRQVDGVTFHHGAQFATSTGPDFSRLIAALTADGRAAHWTAAGGNGQRLAFGPDMSALPKRLADDAIAAGALLQQGDQAVDLVSADEGWRAHYLPSSGTVPGAVSQHGGLLSRTHDAVVVAIPAPQAAALLARIAPAVSARAETAVLAPCWAMGAQFAAPIDMPDVWQSTDGAVAWAAREASRPLSPAMGARGPDAWMLHASADWSRQHLDNRQDTIGVAMLDDFAHRVGTAKGEILFAHRWRHARVERPVGEAHLWDPTIRVGACGDWCIGPRIEAAFDSGLSLARAILEQA